MANKLIGFIISDPAGNYDVEKDHIFQTRLEANRACKSLNEDLYEDDEDCGQQGHYMVGAVYDNNEVSFDC